jgi:hypothetical protein
MESKIEKNKNNKYLKQVQERSGSLPKGQKGYLLNKLFGLLSVKQICERLGIAKSTLYKYVGPGTQNP